MRRYRIYLDTSVIGGAHDDEFKLVTRRLLAAITSGDAVAVISPMLIDEVQAAPEVVRNTLFEIAPTSEMMGLSIEAENLRAAYLAAGVVDAKSASDALHVAYATCAHVDVIASWNFKHLVNSNKIRQFSAVNIAEGYGLVVILTPDDVLHMVEAERNEEDETI